MNTQLYTLSVQLLSIEEFGRHYPQYGNFARQEGRFLYDLIMTPENFINARAVTLSLGLPAISGIAKMVAPLLERQTDEHRKAFIKQFVGAVVCALMEANGFEKKNERKAVHYPGFTKGEVYQVKGNSPYA